MLWLRSRSVTHSCVSCRLTAVAAFAVAGGVEVVRWYLRRRAGGRPEPDA